MPEVRILSPRPNGWARRWSRARHSKGDRTMATARIFRPAKTAMQSGRGNTLRWVLEYEPATPRDPDPLMGWASARDTLNQVRLRFPTLEEAKEFADRRGIEYTVVQPP